MLCCAVSSLYRSAVIVLFLHIYDDDWFKRPTTNIHIFQIGVLHLKEYTQPSFFCNDSRFNWLISFQHDACMCALDCNWLRIDTHLKWFYLFVCFYSDIINQIRFLWCCFRCWPFSICNVTGFLFRKYIGTPIKSVREQVANRLVNDLFYIHNITTEIFAPNSSFFLCVAVAFAFRN